MKDDAPLEIFVYHKGPFLRDVRKIFWKNKTLYTLVLTSFAHQGVRNFNCPGTFAHALNEQAMMVAEAWRATCQKSIQRSILDPHNN